jgi:hypothetical protein
MRIVPIHQWKVPLKYRAMLLFPSGPLGLGGAVDTMVWGGGVPTKWREQKSMSTYILKLRRNSTGVPYYVTEASSRRHCHCRCRCSPLVTTTTTVAPWLRRRCRRRCHHRHRHCSHHLLPPLFWCDLFDCCVCSVIVSSPLPRLVVAISPTASAIIIVVVVVIVDIVVVVVVVVVVVFVY